MIAKNLISHFEDSFKQHWALPAMTNYEGRSYTYGEMAEAIDQWHLFFASQGLQHGDKVALMGKYCRLFGGLSVSRGVFKTTRFSRK